MKELEEIYNRLYDEYIDARREHFESALDMKKNGGRINRISVNFMDAFMLFNNKGEILSNRRKEENGIRSS